MRISLLFFVVLVASASLPAVYAQSVKGYVPEVGSCKPSAMGKNWVDCVLRNPTDGSTINATVLRSSVRCYQLAGYQDNPGCIYPPLKGECVFKNPYSFPCTESVEADGDPARTVKEACEQVLACLNDPGCIKTYCGSTELRFGWVLDSHTD
jgi:hypothetical protein